MPLTYSGLSSVGAFSSRTHVVSEIVQTVAASIVVSGRVQRVGYRFFTVDAAEQLDITGWVKNLSDGRVEVEAYGFKENVETMIARLRQGPPGALVIDVDVTWMAEELWMGRPRDFQILR